MARRHRVTSIRWLESGKGRQLALPVSQADSPAAPQAAHAGQAAGQPVPRSAETPAACPSSVAAPLWLALHAPSLRLEAAFTAEARAREPCAVLLPEARVQRVVDVNARARAAGVQPGMAVTAALALEPALQARLANPRAEDDRLRLVATLALGFTPQVSLEPPDAVLLEVRSSLRLFGGIDGLLAELAARARLLDTALVPALAPTPLAALLGARATASRLAPPAGPAGSMGWIAEAAFRVEDRARLVGALAPLSLDGLRWPPAVIERLASAGVHRLGEVLRLPRAGFARRFGREQLAALDRLTGRQPEARAAFVAPERFAARCEPGYELSDHEHILRYLEPLLLDLERFLRLRQSAIERLACRLRHRGSPATRLDLAFAEPAFEALHLRLLLRERLAALTLPEPVTRCELRSGPLRPLAAQSEALWRPGEHGGVLGRETPQLVERLRARLGAESVYGLCLVPQHRPESAWGVAEPRPAAQGAPSTEAVLPRPLWLLRTPEPLQAAPARPAIVSGPERIETGWWDGHEVLRDYYVVRDAGGAELWVFRERRAPHRWFLHGVFG